jgi:hypothetical protein
MAQRNDGGTTTARLSRGLRLFVKKRTLTCKEATAVISESFEREPPFHRNALLRLHLLACGACARFLRQLRFLRYLMRLQNSSPGGTAMPDASLSAAARERIKLALRRKSADPSRKFL